MAEDAATSQGRSVYFKIPANWDDLTEDEQTELALQFVRAAKKVAGEGARTQSVTRASGSFD